MGASALSDRALLTIWVSSDLCDDVFCGQDIIGDAFYLLQVWEHRHVEWVNRLLVPFAVFFVLGGIVSVGSIFVKGRLFVEKLRTRGLRHGSQELKIGDMLISGRFRKSSSKLGSVEALAGKFEEHRMERWRYYTYIASGLLEVKAFWALFSLCAGAH